MATLLRKIDLILLTVIALVASIISLFDFFNIIEGSTTNYSLLTLFLVSMIGMHLIVSYFSQEDYQKETLTVLDRIAQGLKTLDFQEFHDAIEIESHLAQRILEARRCVCDLTWKRKLSPGFSAKDRQLSHTYMDKCIAEASERIPYREVFIFSDPRRVQKLMRRLSENKPGYSCRYFREEPSIPRLQFVIVDEEEVFFFASSPNAPLCSFRSKELARVLKAYYEAIWQTAISIKEGNRIYTDEVEKVRKIYPELFENEK